jgi:hypothetical protein
MSLSRCQWDPLEITRMSRAATRADPATPPAWRDPNKPVSVMGATSVTGSTEARGLRAAAASHWQNLKWTLSLRPPRLLLA